MTPPVLFATPQAPPTDQPLNAQQTQTLARYLIHKYFTTQLNPLTKHHLESFDQFIQRDLRSVIATKNPLIILKNPRAQRNVGSSYKYKVEVYIGGPDSTELFVGTPTIVLQRGEDVRALYPNEARLRNLTYALPIEANIHVKITIQLDPTEEERAEKKPGKVYEETKIIPKVNLVNFPLMLHSNYCLLHGKSSTVLQQMGECPEDPGGYFIINGSEKVLVTRQEGAFNTLWITPQPSDDTIEYYCTISSLNPISREVRRTNFYWTRERTVMSRGFRPKPIFKPSVLEIQIPFVLKPIPVFILFRAMGIQTDKEILKLIFPDFQSPEAKYLADMLIPSINAAHPFLDTFSAIEYIKSLTKGFSKFHVLDILHNHLFPHVEDIPKARVTYLADCVRKILRVAKGLEPPPSRDDTRYQRLLTSGFLCQQLFQNIYKAYLAQVSKRIDEMYNYNESAYTNMDFLNIFSEANHPSIFAYGFITEGIMRGFKGKWLVGNNHEAQGVLQELSRLSYLDFVSHLRHAVLDFDTSMKLQGPRRLHPSQYGYFCTNETPSGASIGITKNLTIMTSISNGMIPARILKWLFERGRVIPCEYITPELATVNVPVYLNAGIVGYTTNPILLTQVLRLLKRTGCLPPLSSNGFSISERRIFLFVDDGRPLRPLIAFPKAGTLPNPDKFKGTWRDMVVGTLPQTESVQIYSNEFVDPLADKTTVSLEMYIELLSPHQGVIEYLDPSEQNEAFIANVPEHILPESTHMEVHPSTILGLLVNCIPYPNHNQSPRNQLSASQSKQAVSLYATNYKNRYDNTANVLCYGQAPLSRTIYQDYFGEGKMPYGQNIILAMGMYGGYNQEDGIIMNADALARGQFRSLNFRSYEAFEEDDKLAKTSTRIGNPLSVPQWLDLKTQLDYNQLDENGIIKVGSYVTQNTVIVGRYMMLESGQIVDASVTPQVWTRGRVESVTTTVNIDGKYRIVKVRVTQDRVPELGDKFSNRHGQKGTLNILYRGHDMPRTADGLTPDMIMNPTAIPSRMTIGQILEMMFGSVAAELGAIANTTAFMNDGSPHEILGQILERLGLHKLSNQVLYNGMTGEQIEADIYMGVVYGMRLKHMTEDKWNARGQGRKEMRTHQPTGGRGNEGGLKIGEMDRDAILGHGVSAFLQESMMARSDGSSFIVCNGCGTFPIYNEREDVYLCPLCDGPIEFAGSTANTLEPIPPPVRSAATFSKVEMPYSSKLWIQEMETFANMHMRLLTTRDTMKLGGLEKIEEQTNANVQQLLQQPLPRVPLRDIEVPKPIQPIQAPVEADIAAELAKLQEDAVEAFQKENAVAQPVAPQLAANVLAQTAQAQQQVDGVAPVAPAALAPAALAPAALAPALAPTMMELAPGSVAPAPILPAMEQQVVQASNQAPPMNAVQLVAPQQGGAMMMTQSNGVPVLNVDTSPAALQAAGFRTPGDATAPLVPRFEDTMNFDQPQQQRRSRSRSPQQQRFSPQPQPISGGAEEQGPVASSAPVTVIKLG
jgi:DNA-directed RNA polymerase II subunit RPB2